jgi:hypothetical protein
MTSIELGGHAMILCCDNALIRMKQTEDWSPGSIAFVNKVFKECRNQNGRFNAGNINLGDF